MGRRSKPPTELLTQLPCNVPQDIEREVKRIANDRLGRSNKPGEITRSLVELGLYVAQQRKVFEDLLNDPAAEPVLTIHLRVVIEQISKLATDIYLIPPNKPSLPEVTEETETRELKPAGRAYFLRPMAFPMPERLGEDIAPCIRSDQEHSHACAEMRRRWTEQPRPGRRPASQRKNSG